MSESGSGDTARADGADEPVIPASTQDAHESPSGTARPVPPMPVPEQAPEATGAAGTPTVASAHAGASPTGDPSSAATWSPAPTATIDTEEAPTAASTRPRRRAGAVINTVLWVIALLAMIGLVVLSVSMYLTNAEWQSQNEELRDTAESLGEEVAALTAQNTLLESQLEQSHETVNESANEAAFARDDLMYLEDISSALAVCVDDYGQLVDYLDQSYLYTDASLAAYESDVETYCSEVVGAWDDYADGDE